MACCGSGGSSSAQAVQAQGAVAQAASHEVALRYQFGMVGEFFYGAVSGIAYRVPSSHVIFADPRDVEWFLALHKHGKPLFLQELPPETEGSVDDLEGSPLTPEEPNAVSQGEGDAPQALAALPQSEALEVPPSDAAEAEQEGVGDEDSADADGPEDSTPDAPQQGEPARNRPGRKPKNTPQTKAK